MSSARGFGAPGKNGGHPTDAAVRLVCALIGAAALVAVVLVATVSGDSGTALGLPAAPAPAVSRTTSEVPGAAATSPAATSSAVASPSSPVPRRELSPAYVQAHFPFPPDTTPVTGGHRPSVPGIRLMQVRAGLAEVKHFYEVSLPSIGGQWQHVLATETTGGVVAGWNGGVFFPTLRGFEPQLFLDDDYYGDQPGVVRIEVDFR